MRPFVTPLFEVSTEIDVAFAPVVEFRARSFHEAIKARCPGHQQFPIVVVPPEMATPEQLQATPAVYRFFSADNKWSAFYGPRMAAANVRGWPGYEQYRSFVGEVVGAFLDLAIDPTVERYSVGFYNRIPIADVAELQDVLSAPVGLSPEMSLGEMVWQSARMTPVGSVLTQVMMRPADALTNEQHLAVNNIVRNVRKAEEQITKDVLMAWLDRAHDVGKEVIWNLLSERARNSWKANSA